MQHGNKGARAAGWALVLALLGWQAGQVEDGQFTREYSRLYTALVLGMGTILLLLVSVGIWQALRGQRGDSEE